MLESLDDLAAVARALYPAELPKPFLLIDGARRVRGGEDPAEVARDTGTTRKRLEAIADAPDPVAEVFGISLAAAADPSLATRPRAMIGNLLLGEIAERAFEGIYKKTMGSDDLILEDDRSARNDTDYRVLNGHQRPVFRINIKFHGSPFRKAAELVGLEPEDCFALATYKIYQGLQKHETEHLPYVFVIVGVPGLTGASVGEAIPERLSHLLSLIHNGPKVPGKRAIEERVVAYLLGPEQPEPFRANFLRFRAQIEAVPWYVLSARRANLLLREKLFDRVYAVRVRGFSMNYRNAELDMHFSLSKDLTPLPDFLSNARVRGLHGLAVDLERGVI
jgi:hypothetical protein